MVNQLSSLYLSLRDFVIPLKDDLSSPEGLEYLFYRYGWTITLKDGDFTKINQLWGIQTVVVQLITEVDSLREKSAADPNFTPGAQDIEKLAQLARQLYDAVRTLESANLSGLAEPLNSKDFWSDVADQLLDDLQEQFIRVYYPKIYVFLHLFGIIRYQPTTTTAPHRRTYNRTIVDWSQIGALVEDPFTAFKNTYHWGDQAKDFDYRTLLSALQKVLHALGVSATLTAPNVKTITGLPSTAPFQVKTDESALRVLFLYALSAKKKLVYQVGVEALPIIKKGETKPSGLLLKPLLRGGLGLNLPVARHFNLVWQGSADAGNAIAVSLFPDKADVLSGLPTIATSLAFTRTNTGTPWYLIGDAKSTRIELSGISIGLAIEGSVNDPEIQLQVKTGQGANTPGCKVVIPLDESDNFLKSTLNKPGIEFSFDAGMTWSTKTGLRFNGDANIDITLPLQISIGGVTLQNAHIALGKSRRQTNPHGVELRIGTELQGSFGPVSFVVEDMGFSAEAILYSKEEVKQLPSGSKPLLGNMDFSLHFMPPKGIGIAIDAQSIKGAGYLYFDTDKGEYAGVAQLCLQNKINVKAVGIILTHMPDGSPGYSFLLLISAEFPAIQLGLGFTLSGVGGLVGIHRGIDVQRLQDGIYNNDINNVLFPEDPLNNAPSLISSIDRLFPPTPQQYTFGLMAKLGWGPENIISIELGLILEFPEPVRLALIGVLRAEVTTKVGDREIKALQLQVNFAGYIDFNKEFIRFDAALTQSKLLDMKLEGDMALRVKYGDNPDFAVTLGGFHPSFQPPALDLPAKMNRLEIILHSGNPSITVACYLAVTSNTIQFGLAGLFLFEKWGVRIRGELSFDALFQLDPFHFETDVHFLLAASWKGYDFASIEVNGVFAGPSPWSLKASLKLKVWIFSKTVHLDETWGDADNGLPDGIRILPLLAADLNNANNWERKTGRSNLSVMVRKPSDSAGTDTLLTLHPNELISVKQSTVPLGIHIDRFSARKPQGAAKFSLSLLRKNTAVPATVIQSPFASAQFIDMEEAQKLQAPSYELFDAGLSFDGLDAVSFDQFTVQPLSYETGVIDDPAVLTPPAAPTVETNQNFNHGLINGSLANSPIGIRAGIRRPVARTISERFLIVDQTNFTATSTPPVHSEAQARQLLQQAKAQDLHNVLSLAVLPAAALVQ